MSDTLADIIGQKVSQPVYPAIQALTDQIRAKIPNAAAILFYGSCLRSGQDIGGMADLYVLVDAYRHSGQNRFWAAMNALLPPNVFYLEIPFEDRRVRAKYAVLSLSDFEQGVSMRWFHSYIWGRFAQPIAIAYARSRADRERVITALEKAVTTFMRRALPCTRAPFAARDLWFKALSLSYRSELRAEKPDKLAKLVALYDAYYELITRAAIAALPYDVAIEEDGAKRRYNPRVSKNLRFRARQIWRLRFFQGKVLSILRLLKGAFTFSGGIAYVQWKIERHTGVRADVPAHLERFPIIAVGVLAWRTYRQGGFR
ncbi:MAG: hypothetical protein QNI97_04380 [Desulfobacterales bacterium]|nr:hypothetical protein [Desulfobacterales bacterium]MDJ0853997.1 hypothetical protein [Desulfobacterales bacterium]